MSMQHYCDCGEEIQLTRWHKGKRDCGLCGAEKGAAILALQCLFGTLPLETQINLLRQYFVDSPEWSMVEAKIPPTQEE